MAEIKVPKPPKTAFNPQRRASGLLRDQVEHLEWAVRHAGERAKGGKQAYRVKPVRTEADVAARMKSLLPTIASAAELPFLSAPVPARDAAGRSKSPATRTAASNAAHTRARQTTRNRRQKRARAKK